MFATRSHSIGSEVSLLLQVQSLINDNAEMRSSRRISLGVMASIVFHALLLLFLVREPTEGVAPPEVSGPLVVRLNSAPPPPVADESPTPPQPKKALKPDSVIAVNRATATPDSIPPPPVKPETAPDTEAPPVDMMALLNASRQRREAAETAAASENAQAREYYGTSTANERREASLKRNLQSLTQAKGGTNGVFQIVSKGTRTAKFSFRGWTQSERNSQYQLIEVDAGLHGNIDLAIVRKMIEIIRTHYKGNFNWESHRLHRVVVQSARLEDTVGLEEFLLQEFFSDVG